MACRHGWGGGSYADGASPAPGDVAFIPSGASRCCCQHAAKRCTGGLGGLGGCRAGAAHRLVERGDTLGVLFLVEERLGKLAGIERLEFNLINRVLGVWHRLPSTTPIEAAISALGMQAEVLLLDL